MITSQAKTSAARKLTENKPRVFRFRLIPNDSMNPAPKRSFAISKIRPLETSDAGNVGSKNPMPTVANERK